MCSVQEEGITVPEERPKLRGRACMKCNQPASVVIRGADPMCNNCFVGYCTHKFRAAFGKSRVVRDGEDALVAFSGGINSSAMLHLIQEGKSPRANRKLRFKPSLVYIDESSVLSHQEDAPNEHCQSVVQRMVATGLPWCVYRLEEVFDIPNEEEASDEALSANSSPGLSAPKGEEDVVMSDLEGQLKQLQLRKNHVEKLAALLTSARTITAKESLIQKLRTKLLVSVARRRGFSKLLLGDSSTRLAVRMLSEITQGRGAHVALELSFADRRFDDVTIVRPMREFIAKEVAMYLTVNGVDTFVSPTLTTMADSRASMERLTEEFVAGLQAAQPRTVPTIFRTGEKMDVLHLDRDAVVARCALCQAPLDTEVSDSSALNATLFSQSLCSPQTACDRNAGPAGCCGEGDASCQSLPRGITPQNLERALCYGCRLVVRDMDDFAALPEAVLHAAGRATRREKMKMSIQEFLLPDGNG